MAPITFPDAVRNVGGMLKDAANRQKQAGEFRTAAQMAHIKPPSTDLRKRVDEPEHRLESGIDDLGKALLAELRAGEDKGIYTRVVKRADMYSTDLVFEKKLERERRR